MRNEIEIPDWMMKQEDYQVKKDRDSFLSSSSRKILKILGKIKMQAALQDGVEPSAGLSLLLLFVTVTLIVMTQNIGYVVWIVGGMCVILAFCPGKSIRSIVGEVLIGILFAFFFSLPAAVFGNWHTMQTLVIKTAATVMAVALLNHKVRWNQITAALHSIHIPDTLLFAFDMTIKYLFILGQMCGQLLESLKLRSIGHNADKKKATAGILGITYLKSQKMAEDTYLAMNCRGFDGTYHNFQKHKRNGKDVLLFVELFMVCILFYLFQ